MNRACFLPKGYLQRKVRRRSDVIFASILGVVIGAMAVAALAMQIAVHQVKNQHDGVQWQCAQAFRTIQDIKDMRTAEHAIAQQAELTASLVESVPRSNILAEIARSLPSRVSLTDLSLDGDELKITGVARTDLEVNQTIAQLDRSPLFINVVRMDPVGGSLPKFQLEMTLNPKATGSSHVAPPPSRIVQLPSD